jgi:hypothetical protein
MLYKLKGLTAASGSPSFEAETYRSKDNKYIIVQCVGNMNVYVYRLQVAEENIWA